MSSVPFDRRADIESVHRVQRLPGLRSGHVNLPGRILHHAGIEGQQIADVARGRIGNVHDLRRVHRALVGGLLGIDAGHRRGYVHLLAHDLLVRQHHLHAVLARVNPALIGLVESGLLHVNPVRLLLPQREGAVSRVIRPQMRRLQSRFRDRHLRAGNRHAVLVDYRNGDGRAKLLRLPAGDDGAEEKKQARHGPPGAFKTQHEDKSELAFAVPPRRQYTAGPCASPVQRRSASRAASSSLPGSGFNGTTITVPGGAASKLRA